MKTENIEQAISDLASSVLHSVPKSLRDSILYSLLGGGKRIRPRMVITAGDAPALSRETSNRLATALEMIHTYTLIHDDLPAMDNDDYRRGKLTNHKVFGEARAVLAGDSLALAAFDLLTPLNSLESVQALLEAAGARGVIAGQVAEIELRESKSPTLEELFEVFRLKTGALFKAALLLPVLNSSHSKDQALRDAVSLLGDSFGIAFQIADDLEDDFAQKKSDAAHLAAYLSQADSRLKAEEILGASFAHIERIHPALAKALEPFMNELSQKIMGTSE